MYSVAPCSVNPNVYNSLRISASSLATANSYSTSMAISAPNASCCMSDSNCAISCSCCAWRAVTASLAVPISCISRSSAVSCVRFSHPRIAEFMSLNDFALDIFVMPRLSTVWVVLDSAMSTSAPRGVAKRVSPLGSWYRNPCLLSKFTHVLLRTSRGVLPGVPNNWRACSSAATDCSARVDNSFLATWYSIHEASCLARPVASPRLNLSTILCNSDSGSVAARTCKLSA